MRPGGDRGLIELCRLDEIADGQARGFVFGAGTERRAIFVVRRGGAVFGYENRCPHAGSPLDFLPDRFVTADGLHLLCGTHGAIFRVEDGVCLSGPCEGQRLDPVAVVLAEGVVSLDE